MRVKGKIIIIPSMTLTQGRLEGLVGRTGEVLEICYRADGLAHGIWVKLDGEPFLGEQEWFIPKNSYISNE